MKQLMQLNGVVDLSPAFLSSEGATFDAGRSVAAFERPLNVEPLENLVRHAMGKFSKPEESDSWLAPRVHYALRLTRREAARRGLWMWLAVVLLPDYVRWRFPGKHATTDRDRFLGRGDKHALGRLWWGAEMMRDGDDYTPVATAFTMQDIPNSWMRLDAFHHRPLVQATIGKLATYNNGKPATSDQVAALSKAVNAAARTVLLDSLAPDPDLDPAALEAWLGGEPDETDVFDDEPSGPPEERTPQPSVEALEAMIERVISGVPSLQPQKQPQETEPA